MDFSFERIALSAAAVGCGAVVAVWPNFMCGAAAAVALSRLANVYVAEVFWSFALFLQLCFAVGRTRYELPALLARMQTVLVLAVPFLACLAAEVLPSTRYLHFAQFGVVKLLLVLLLHVRSRIVLLAAVLGTLYWAVVPVVIAGQSVSTAAVVTVALLTGIVGIAQHGKDASLASAVGPPHAVLAVVAFVYLVVSRALLAHVEHELRLPLFTQNFLRSFGAGWLFVIVIVGLRFRGNRDDLALPASASVIGKIAVFALLQSQLPVVLIAYAVRTTSSALVSALIATTPVLAVLAGWAWLRKPLERLQIALVACGLCGAVLITASEFRLAHWAGVALALGAALSWAIGGLFNEAHLKEVPLLPKAMIQSFSGSLLSLAAALVMGEGFSSVDYDGKALAYLGFLTFGFSFVSLFATVYLLRQVGTVHATSVWFVVPLCSLVLMYDLRLLPLPGPGAAVLQLLGCTLVLAAMTALLAPPSN